MAKSILDIQIAFIQNGVMTVNEARSQIGLDNLRDAWSEAYTGAHNAGRVAVLEQDQAMRKIKCGYCSRPNPVTACECERCGAPLELTPEG